jgi:hypothetical protein
MSVASIAGPSLPSRMIGVIKNFWFRVSIRHSTTP